MTSSCRRTAAAGAAARDVITDVIINAQRSITTPTSRILDVRCEKCRRAGSRSALIGTVCPAVARTAPAPPPDVARSMARSALAGARTHADCAEIRSARGSAAIRGSATRPKSSVRPSQNRRMRLSHFSRTGLIQFHIRAISFTKWDN